MKKITYLFTLLMVTISFAQNEVTNGDFELPGSTTANTGAGGVGCPDWSGFKNRIVLDDLTSSFSGQVENGDGSLFQLPSGLTPGATYNITFNYRWVGAGGTSLTVRVKDELNVTGTGKPNLDLDFDGTTADGYPLLTTVDTWLSGAFSITIPAGVNTVRLLFFKGNGNRPLNLDNIVFTDSALSVSDLEANNFKTYPNPAKDVLNVSATSNINTIDIYSILGQKVISEKINALNKQINVSNLAKGVYIIKTQIGDTIGSHKFIKE